MVDRNAKAIADQLLALSARDRAHIAQLVLASLNECEASSESQWNQELDRRIAELGGREPEDVSAEQVFVEVERRLIR